MIKATPRHSEAANQRLIGVRWPIRSWMGSDDHNLRHWGHRAVSGSSDVWHMRHVTYWQILIFIRCDAWGTLLMLWVLVSTTIKVQGCARLIFSSHISRNQAPVMRERWTIEIIWNVQQRENFCSLHVAASMNWNIDSIYIRSMN